MLQVVTMLVASAAPSGCTSLAAGCFFSGFFASEGKPIHFAPIDTSHHRYTIVSDSERLWACNRRTNQRNQAVVLTTEIYKKIIYQEKLTWHIIVVGGSRAATTTLLVFTTTPQYSSGFRRIVGPHSHLDPRLRSTWR